MALAVALVWLTVRALSNPVDHDIDQYLGGAMLGAEGRVFRDFLHLQPPLQLWLWTPVIPLLEPHAFVLLHAMTVLAGLGIALLTWRGARIIGAPPGAALAGALLLALCEPFQYAVTTLRNDALPAIIGAMAMVAAILAVRGNDARLGAFTGVLWGLASSGKLLHLVIAGAGGSALLILAWRGRIAWRVPLAAAAGGLIGLMPAVIVAAGSWDAFRWGVFEFAARAPFAWNLANGRGERLLQAHELLVAGAILVEGPALVAILLRIDRWRLREGEARPDLFLLDALIVGALAAAMMPTPVQRGYFLPVLAPLFVRLSPLLADIWRDRRRWPLALLAIGVVAGLVRTPVLGVLALQAGSPMLSVEREAHWLGERMRAAGVMGPVATLSPRLVLDSGMPLDPRFATGVFVFRTGALLSRGQADRFNVATPAGLEDAFRRVPPAAIVTGYEGARRRFPADPDAALVRYARRHGWVELESPIGNAVLFLNPTAAKGRP
ncbi:hypothetical protein GGR88_000903 [Sphingomonas jejuensis]|uniref:Glycosyltransferase RgtA/B/C/D-like domain-containing protein n=1 Tax=Sphingomonas jejuensis TaxID=904715 RepID=A0ABX0XKR1_9SPHN|nr:glycosyltransferase family 39 protein [Sphingomonas jejuensis]NJC33429.1 hypothetical protein [Sphingomonas jejuensis]